jgi:hypothetical protein
MTVTTELPSDIEADLVGEARWHGLELPQYVEHLLREWVSPRTCSALSPAELASAWRDSTRGLPNTPLLSDAAISRESTYTDSGP